MELDTLELMDATEEEVAGISDIIDEPSELNEASVIFEKLFSGELCWWCLFKEEYGKYVLRQREQGTQLVSLKDMLRYFAASGHNLYTKCIYISTYIKWNHYVMIIQMFMQI